jgi:hypothetical protein
MDSAPSHPVPAASTEVRPVPDPTILTTLQLHREILGLREVIETRLAGMDKAIELIQSAADKVPSKMDVAIQQLRELQDEKFTSIAIQFRERDTRTEQTSRDSKVAVDAALQAAKEAVGEQNKSNALAISKSEATFTKQIDQLGILINTMTTGLNDKIDDIKTRLSLIEGQRKGTGDAWGYIVGIGGLIVAIAILFMKETGR